MNWKVEYHPEVVRDLEKLGRAEASRVIKVIEERIVNGEPDKSSRALHGALAGCRRIRTGDIRLVYRIQGDQVVLMLCIGPRRDDEVYVLVEGRVSTRHG